jgi:hypothetical protein
MKHSFGVLLALIANSVAAEPAGPIIVTGNKRTQGIYIERMVKECLRHQENDNPGVVGHPQSSSSAS